MLDIIKRNTPAIAGAFVCETIPKADGLETYEIEALNGKIVLRGDSALTLAMAYGRYLKDCCGISFSLCGNRGQTVEQAPLPREKTVEVIKQKYRFFLDYPAYGNGACWWDWERWEREIDVMAVHGVNLPLSIVGSEAVLFYTLKDLGYSAQGAMSFLSGPAYFPRQLEGGFDSFLPLTDEKYIEARLSLGKKILARQQQLGMTPVMQGFTGQVPKTIIRLFPKSRIRHIPSQNGFPPTYHIDPSDPQFQKLGGKLLQKQLTLLGASHYYMTAPFRSGVTPGKNEHYRAAFAKALMRVYTTFDAQSVWVLPSDCADEGTLKAVENGRLLVVGLDRDIRPEEGKAPYGGHAFVVSTLCSREGRTALAGDIARLCANEYEQVKNGCPNAAGTGLCPGSTQVNPVLTDIALEMLTKSGSIEPRDMFRRTALLRWGSREDCLVEALELLAETCYGKGIDEETGSVVCARPGTVLSGTAPGESMAPAYDNAKLALAAERLLAAKDASTDAYAFDACDVARQALSNLAMRYYKGAMEGYFDKDVRRFEICSNGMLRLIEDLESLVMTRPEWSLLRALKEAGANALKDTDKQNFEINLLTQITLWGPNKDPVLYDNAWREWGGVVESFYGPRWRGLFETLASSFKGLRRFSTVTKKQPGGRDEYAGNAFYRSVERFERKWVASCKPEDVSGEDPVETARRLMKKYAEEFGGELA
ncbi:MAG TPA: alpha-N-acetylglucosaminidase TIM-barrel domain-containing protein [Clostridiales bacterium]|nr:alpha-N-acetylglucosaminidase TIM-barrel domain-containing protein [Clostridiales bacterium]HQK74414.1 alpha-N-acetylglucosaminidase TIM-barrel domain-containing protein [Clostridiales bacterium]